MGLAGAGACSYIVHASTMGVLGIDFADSAPQLPLLSLLNAQSPILQQGSGGQDKAAGYKQGLGSWGMPRSLRLSET